MPSMMVALRVAASTPYGRWGRLPGCSSCCICVRLRPPLLLLPRALAPRARHRPEREDVDVVPVGGPLAAGTRMRNGSAGAATAWRHRKSRDIMAVCVCRRAWAIYCCTVSGKYVWSSCRSFRWQPTAERLFAAVRFVVAIILFRFVNASGCTRPRVIVLLSCSLWGGWICKCCLECAAVVTLHGCRTMSSASCPGNCNYHCHLLSIPRTDQPILEETAGFRHVWRAGSRAGRRIRDELWYMVSQTAGGQKALGEPAWGGRV